MKFLSLLVFSVILLSTSTFVFADNEPMIEVLETSHNQATGEEEPTVILVKNAQTGQQTIVGLDADPKVAKIRAILAFRLKFPELVGIRVGMNIDQLVDIGFEAGTGLFFSSAGAFINYYPAGQSKHAIRNLYIGGRYQREAIFAIFAVAEGDRIEGIMGYKFDKKQGGFHSFIEAGAARQVGPLYGSSIFGPNDVGYEAYPFPIVTIGIGWTIPGRK